MDNKTMLDMLIEQVLEIDTTLTADELVAEIAYVRGYAAALKQLAGKGK